MGDPNQDATSQYQVVKNFPAKIIVYINKVI